jgi:hypothetical protein
MLLLLVFDILSIVSNRVTLVSLTVSEYGETTSFTVRQIGID